MKVMTFLYEDSFVIRLTNMGYKRKVKIADNLGPMAWLFLQENVQVQYLQKIALCAENTIRP